MKVVLLDKADRLLGSSQHQQSAHTGEQVLIDTEHTTGMVQHCITCMHCHICSYEMHNMI